MRAATAMTVRHRLEVKVLESKINATELQMKAVPATEHISLAPQQLGRLTAEILTPSEGLCSGLFPSFYAACSIRSENTARSVRRLAFQDFVS